MFRLILVLLFVVALCTKSAGQVQHADHYYNQFNYSKAVELYSKALKKGETPYVLKRLGQSYKALKDYSKAEVYLSKYILLNPMDTTAHFELAEVYMNNNNYQLAKEQFLAYYNLNPKDKTGRLLAKACDDIKDWSTIPSKFTIQNLEKLNTASSEFCAVEYKNKIVFISDREEDFVTEQSSGWNERPYLTIFYADRRISGDTFEFGRISEFSRRLNDQFHNGPVSFTGDYKIAYFNKTGESKVDDEHVNRPEIFIANEVSEKWSKPVPFEYNNPDYTMGHPYISKDGQLLVFASDMPGSMGGKDIFYCTRNGERWSEPINVGAEINTNKDEVFPVIGPDNTLYFSSNGHEGLGGLDIFSAEYENGKWKNILNLHAPVNSSTDDFNMYFRDDNITGYFSSDRPGGKGSDDIYFFRMDNTLVDVKGKIVLGKEEGENVSNVKVLLVTDQGNILQTSTSDTTGSFMFRNISPDQYYAMQIQEDDATSLSLKKFYLKDDKDRIVSETASSENGFVFKNLPPDFSRLAAIDPDQVSFKRLEGNLFVGDTYDQPLSDTRIHLVDKDGLIIQTVMTNKTGGFQFNRLPSDESYVIKIDQNDPELKNHKLFLRDNQGNVILETNTDQKGSFIFSLLSTDKNVAGMIYEEDATLKKVDFKGSLTDGNNLPVANRKIVLLDNNGEVIRSFTTDEKGGFHFVNLSSMKNYVIGIDETDNSSLPPQIIVYGPDGKKVKEISTASTGKFVYNVLPSDHHRLSVISEDDLQFKRSMSGYLVNPDDNSQPVANSQVYILDEKGNVLYTAITDEKGKFIFRNLPPDQNYIVSMSASDPALAGIRRVAILNDKKDVVTSSELVSEKFHFEILPYDKSSMSLLAIEEVPERKSMKGRFTADNNQPLKDTRILLVDDKGNIIGTAKTNEKGDFEFINLPPDKNYVVMIDDQDATGFRKVVLSDQNGKQITTALNSNGKFNYQVLATDANIMTSSEYAEEGSFRKRIRINGTLVEDKDSSPLKNILVKLIDNHGDIIQTTRSDQYGKFSFVNLAADKNYVVQLEQNDPGLANKGKVRIIDNNGKTISISGGDAKGFNFVLLTSEKNTLGLIAEEDALVATSLKGRFMSEDKKPLANAIVNVYDETGKVVATGRTDEKGDFIFVNLPADKNYVIGFDPSETTFNARKIILADSKGNVIRTEQNIQGKGFKYELLKSDKSSMALLMEEETGLRKDLSGQLMSGNANGTVLSGIKVQILQETGEIYQSVRTDRFGKFRFINLPSDKKFVVMIDENDPRIKSEKKILMVDSKGKLIREFVKDPEGNFVFNVLPHESFKGRDEVEGDTELRSMTGSQKGKPAIVADNMIKTITKGGDASMDTIYYSLNKTTVGIDFMTLQLAPFVNALKMNPGSRLDISSFADSRGTNEYNKELTKRRNKAVQSFFIRRGIPSSRIILHARGESDIMNGCIDGVDCTDEQHAVNRCTIVKLIK